MQRRRLKAAFNSKRWLESEETAKRQREEQEAKNRRINDLADLRAEATLGMNEARPTVDMGTGFTVKPRLPPDASVWAPRLIRAVENLPQLSTIELYEEEHPSAEKLALGLLTQAQKSPGQFETQLATELSLLSEVLRSHLLHAVESILRQIENNLREKAGLLITSESERPQSEDEHVDEGRTRRQSRRPPAERGWIWATDAASEFDIARSTLQGLIGKLDPRDRWKDPDFNQVRVRRKALVALLKRKDQLPKNP